MHFLLSRQKFCTILGSFVLHNLVSYPWNCSIIIVISCCRHLGFEMRLSLCLVKQLQQ